MLTLKSLFTVFGILYILSVIVHKVYFSKLKDNVKISNYVALIAFFLVFYILSGFTLVFFLKGLINKIIILVFSLSPFIIGKFATYEKEKIFTFFQFVVIFASIIFVLLL